MNYVEEYREHLREQLAGGIEALGLEWPLKTAEAFRILWEWLGYDTGARGRKYLDYCIQIRHMEPPEKVGARLAWTAENVLDFAMILEDLRYWRPGFHDAKKTCFELQADAERMQVEPETWRDLRSLSAFEIMERMVATGDEVEFEQLAAALEVHIPTSVPPDSPIWSRLAALSKAEDFAVRKALAESIADEIGKEHRNDDEN